MKKLFIIGAVAVCTSCSHDSAENGLLPPEEQDNAVQLLTRVDGDAVASSINAGLYMVNYVNGSQDELLATSNYVNNQLMIFADNTWSSSNAIYWMDATTPADFYVYAPYCSDVEDARNMAFCVQTDQTTAENVAKSDFLWGTIQGQSPTDNGIDMGISHMLSQLTVKVTAAENLSASLKAEDVSVTIGWTKTAATIDLATGAITPVGEAQEVVCHSNGDLSYTAILIPQQVPFSNLVQIVWDGNPYTLQNACKLEAKRKYTLTVKLKKTESGFNVGIDGWDIIEEDFGGTVGG